MKSLLKRKAHNTWIVIHIAKQFKYGLTWQSQMSLQEFVLIKIVLQKLNSNDIIVFDSVVTFMLPCDFIGEIISEITEKCSI